MSSKAQITLRVVPNFYQGHTYLWEVEPSFTAPLPWKFQLEFAQVPYDSPIAIPEDPQWKPLSDVMTNVFAWVAGAESNPAFMEVPDSLFYRIKLTAGSKVVYSQPHSIYADIDRPSWLIIREIQRKELLSMRQMSGVPCHLYQRKHVGMPCTHCLSPDTGEVLNPNCTWCLGTGKLGGYHGPYPCWGQFGLDGADITQDASTGDMTNVLRTLDIRFIGNPWVFSKDIVVDLSSEERYVVSKVNSLLEIRRMPIVQSLTATCLTTQDVAYKLGTNTPLGAEKCQ